MLINDRKHLLNWKFCTNTHFISMYYMSAGTHKQTQFKPIIIFTTIPCSEAPHGPIYIGTYNIHRIQFRVATTGMTRQSCFINMCIVVTVFFLLTMGILKVCEEIQGTIKKVKSFFVVDVYIVCSYRGKWCSHFCFIWGSRAQQKIIDGSTV